MFAACLMPSGKSVLGHFTNGLFMHFVSVLVGIILTLYSIEIFE